MLRVYDAEGRYDELRPLPLSRSAGELPAHDFAYQAVAPGEAEDRTAIRNIDALGGAITVYGKNVPADQQVFVMGELRAGGQPRCLVVQRLMPQGTHET
ncbi:MAG: hypothetical protein U1E15_05870 [Hyphomicrobiales bacterium]